MSAYNILVGVGKLYVADVGTAFPSLDQDPTAVAGWTYLGPTDAGVKVDLDETINEFSSDQDIGVVEAVRSAEKVMISANLFEATVDHLALLLAQTPATVPAGTGTQGYKKIGLSRGSSVTKKAFLFRGNSAYGPYHAQYEVPYGYLSGKVGMEYKKDGMTVVPSEFHSLIDPNASSDAEKHGRLLMGNAAAL